MAAALDVDIFDDDGYPTDEYLETFKTFHGTPREFFEHAARGWRYPELVYSRLPWKGEVELVFITGGWSGNESIITAMDEVIFGFRFWESSRRGGLHKYQVPVQFFDTPTFLGSIENHPRMVK